MSTRIDKKIVGFEVVKKEEEAAARAAAAAAREERQSAKIIRMTEQVARPEGLDALKAQLTRSRRRLMITLCM